MRCKTSTIAGLAIAVTALAGCGGDEKSPETEASAKASSATPSASGSSTPSPTDAESSDPFAYNVGERSLQLGAPRRGSGVVTTLLEVKPVSGAPAQPKRGFRWVGIHVRMCAKEGAEGSIYSYNGEWSLVEGRGGEYAGNEYSGDGSSWNDWPSPKFNESAEIVSGQCLKGWMSIEAPSELNVKSVIWRPGGTAVAEWKVGKTL